MAGDKQQVPDADGGKRGNRRTRQSMKDAGVTNEGIALVEALADMLDDAWPSRQKFLDHVNDTGKYKLDRRQLSKELGGKAKPKGPDWRIAELIVHHCAKDQIAAELARIAGLFCAARGVERPPGYEGAITAPVPATLDAKTAAAAANAKAFNRIQLELDNKTNEVEQLRAFCDGTYRKLAEVQAALDGEQRRSHTLKEQLLAALSSLDSRSLDVEARLDEANTLRDQVETLTAQAQAQRLEMSQLGEHNTELVAAAAAKEQEIDQLTHEMMSRSSQYVKELAAARKAIATQEGSLRSALNLIEAQKGNAAAAFDRERRLREQHARLAARVEMDFDDVTWASPPYSWAPYPRPPGLPPWLDLPPPFAPPPLPPMLDPLAAGEEPRRRTMPNTSWSPVSSVAGHDEPPYWGHGPRDPISTDAHRGNSILAGQFSYMAPAPVRRLAVYLLIHFEHVNQTVDGVSKATNLPTGIVQGLLTGAILPEDAETVTQVCAVIGADVGYACRLQLVALQERTLRMPQLGPVPVSASPADLPAPPPIDMYESIVARLSDDNAGDTTPLPAGVAKENGDSDMSLGDTRDSATCDNLVSPPHGDSPVTTNDHDQMAPILVEAGRRGEEGQAAAPALYQSRNYLRSQRRRRWVFRAVTATSAVLISLVFSTVASGVAGRGPGVFLLANLASCYACWAAAVAACAALRRSRRGYRARHTGTCLPKPATVSARASATTGPDYVHQHDDELPAPPAIPTARQESDKNDIPAVEPAASTQGLPQEPQMCTPELARALANVTARLHAGVQQRRADITQLPQRRPPLDWLDE